ncbi:MAG TPA: DUF3800 domain-containing protein [Patescibacteria group bacterium]|nr:DUF3800 domain-containing protein [Patescibacteria group bacterium]
MESYNIFIDESGTASPNSYQSSPYFTLAGVLINDLHGGKLKKELDELKLKYFGKKSYILHANEVKYHLKKRGKRLEDFSKDLDKLLNKCYFSLLFVTVDKKKAYSLGLDAVYVYRQTYTILLSNMLKFLSAKQMKGQIFAEASNSGQDLHLYNAFFHLIRRGIDRLAITHDQAREHLTCLSFVTKPNNDAEEQISDLFGFFGRLKMEIDRKVSKIDDLDPFEKVIYFQAQKDYSQGQTQESLEKNAFTLQ